MGEGCRVALLSMEPPIPDSEYTPFSYGVRRIQASVLADPGLSEVEVRLVEAQTLDPEAWIAEVEDLDADVVGISAYLWSLPTFVEVARGLKRSRPDRLVVFGGPSARPAMFALPPFRESAADIDALVTGEGEIAFRELLRARPRSRDDLGAVPGLHLSGRGGFQPTAPAPALDSLDDLPSPVLMKLIPTHRTVPLESYRGCPLSCAFCEWGDLDKPDKVFSEDYLAAELAALRDARAPSVQIVDAALNLNSRAFRNLVAAERRAGYFKDATLFASIYPTHLDEQHLEFVRGVAQARLDIGLQSFNRDALDVNQRPFRKERFAQVVEELSRHAHVEVELILGLPGDSPASFRETLDRARELPCKVRISHCLVLPDALLTHAPASWEMRFDPVTLMMRSCLGWSEEALTRERNRLIEMAYREGGEITPAMWSFPDPTRNRRRVRETPETRPGLAGVAPEIGQPAPVEIHAQEASQTPDAEDLAPASVALQGVLEERIRQATSGGWTFVEASTRPGELVVIMKTRDGTLILEMRPASPDARAYKVVGGVAFGYRSPRGARMSDGVLRLLDRVLQTLHAPARSALGLEGAPTAPTSVRVRRLPVAP